MDTPIAEDHGLALKKLSEAGFEGQFRSTQGMLRGEARSAELVLRLTSNFLEFGSRTIHKIIAKTKPACKAGCFFCCHVPVSASAIEALAVARFLKAVCTQHELFAVRSQVESYVARTRLLSADQHIAARLRCPLLTADGTCRVHPARPMSCRWTYAFSAAQCEAALDGQGEGIIDADIQSLLWGRAVVQGLTCALDEAGLDSKRYELCSAVIRALDTDKAEERYIQGKPLFEGCKTLEK